MTEIPPDLLARSDQMRAGSADKLDKEIQHYRDMLGDRNGEPDIPFGHLVISIQTALDSEAGKRDVIFILAAAIDRLAR
jgi:hypothetical protein